MRLIGAGEGLHGGMLQFMVLVGSSRPPGQ